MTIRQEMINKLAVALAKIPDSESLISFVISTQNSDGGFRDLSAESDIYYTTFASEILFSYGENDFIYELLNFLENTSIDCKDLTDLASLGRLYVQFAPELLENRKADMLDNLQMFQCDDHGFAIHSDAEAGNIYGTFLTVSMCMDLGENVYDKAELMDFILSLKLPSGSYANSKTIPVGSVPATAAAAVTCYALGKKDLSDTANWLEAAFDHVGGCSANPLCRESDLLSTAVSLFALSYIERDISALQKVNIDYIMSVRDEAGGFCSNGFKDRADSEYTYYGLLGLGSLWD